MFGKLITLISIGQQKNTEEPKLTSTQFDNQAVYGTFF